MGNCDCNKGGFGGFCWNCRIYRMMSHHLVCLSKMYENTANEWKWWDPYTLISWHTLHITGLPLHQWKISAINTVFYSSGSILELFNSLPSPLFPPKLTLNIQDLPTFRTALNFKDPKNAWIEFPSDFPTRPTRIKLRDLFFGSINFTHRSNATKHLWTILLVGS